MANDLRESVGFPPEITYFSPEQKAYMSRSAFYMGNRVMLSVTASGLRCAKWEELELTLADLIDPTTTAHEEQPYELCCDTCGEVFEEYMYGHMHLRQARYCPYCGRRITAVREFGGGTEYVPVESGEGGDTE